MKPGKLAALALLGASVGALVGVAEKYLRNPDDQASILAPGTLTQLPDFHLPDLQQRIHYANEWRGKVMVLNFWASWCLPCRQEIPRLIRLQEELGGKGVQVVGVAIDTPEAAEDFSDFYGINFPVLLGDQSAVAVAHQLGNRYDTLPFTVVLDRNGVVQLRHQGEISPAILQSTLLDILTPASGG